MEKVCWKEKNTYSLTNLTFLDKRPKGRPAACYDPPISAVWVMSAQVHAHSTLNFPIKCMYLFNGSMAKANIYTDHSYQRWQVKMLRNLPSTSSHPILGLCSLLCKIFFCLYSRCGFAYHPPKTRANDPNTLNQAMALFGESAQPYTSYNSHQTYIASQRQSELDFWRKKFGLKHLKSWSMNWKESDELWRPVINGQSQCLTREDSSKSR